MIPQNQRRQEPDLCAVLDQLTDEIKSTLNCVKIGVIRTFYADNQTADIALNYKKINAYEGSPKGITDYQLLVRCPVVVLNGGGGYLTFPIASGDQALVLFCDREIDTWFTNGGINAPQSARVHDLNDGIAIVGIRSVLSSIPTYGTTNVKLYSPADFVVDALDVYTVAPTDYSSLSTIVGWSVLTTKKIFYKKLGKSVYVYFYLAGTSDTTTVSFTLPYTAASVGFSFSGALGIAMDNSSYLSGASKFDLVGGTNIVNCYSNMAAGTWTASGTKIVEGCFRYEAQ